MFDRVFWAKISNHVELNNKEEVFKDECTFLSFLAFQMQLKNKLFLTSGEVEALIPSIEKLGFRSNPFETSPENPFVTLDLVWTHLKHVACDIDVAEVEGTKSVSMPIRAYQEFLTASAACNLK